MMKKCSYWLVLIVFVSWLPLVSCNKSEEGDPGGNNNTNTDTNTVVTNSEIDCWITTGNRNQLLNRQTTALAFGNTNNSNPVITVDSAQRFQQVDGFGYTLTQGSAIVINGLAAAQRTSLLNELFGSASNSIGISYIRLAIGASDLSSSVYSYDDMPAGQTDPTLAAFSIAADNEVVRLVKDVLLINPSIRIVASPWSPPVWMKDNGSSVGGSLAPANYSVYAQYFVKYIQAMQAEGISITAVTPQNEPLNPANNPSLSMTAAQQADFIKNHLGPAFVAAGLTTRIIVYDHNCDRPDYPLSILGDAAANAYVDGSAFHLYGGDISALTSVHNAYPAKNIYFTEQYTASNGDFGGDLQWHIKNVIIGSMRNWSKNALEWNLANDPSFGPHTAGGCTTCLGAVTIGTAGAVTRNVAYYIIGHASKFIPSGSFRIASDNNGSLQTAAFLRADGKKVLIVLNENSNTQNFNLKFKNKWAVAAIPGNAVATYVW